MVAKVERLKTTNVVKTIKHVYDSILVWVCMPSQEASNLVFAACKMN